MLLVSHAQVKAVFGTGKKRVAGCLVDEGKLQKGSTIEVSRGKQGVVFTGKLASLRRIKDNVEEVRKHRSEAYFCCPVHRMIEDKNTVGVTCGVSCQ